jgi:tetratricopeptide (TPR) repeat protein
VFWVRASNAARFEEAYKNIADRLELPGRQDTTSNVLQLVYNWLCSSSTRWIIILDNADDWSVFYPRKEHGHDTTPSASAKNRPVALAKFLPQSQNGSVLITSRSMDVATKLTNGDTDIIKIRTMDEGQAVQLLQNKLSNPPTERTELAQLVLALNYMPLAISQAAGYINRRAPRASVPKYLKELGMSDRKREYLLSESASQLHLDEYASSSVLTTWQISFEHIRQERPSAAKLLSFMSFFNAQEIPEFMLRYYLGSTEGMSNEYNEDGFEEDLNLLRSYSLVTVKSNGDSFDMHQLVQFATRIWLRSFDNEERWRKRFLSALCQEFPTGEFGTWTKCQTLFPHIEGVIERIPENEATIRDWAQVLANAAWYAKTQGLFVQAENMIRKSIAGREKIAGTEHPDTLTSISTLSAVLDNQGKYEEAEALDRRALAGREKILGTEHPDTLKSVSNLAWELERQGRYEEAEALDRRALAGREKILGIDHPDTLTSSSNLAWVLNRQDIYEEAEGLDRRALAGREKMLGYEHPDTLKSVNNLATTLDGQDKYEEAEALYRRALAGREKVLGNEHPDTLVSVHNLARMLGKQDRYEETEGLDRRALAGREKMLGDEHPDTLHSVQSLGWTLGRQEKYEEAEALYRRALAGRKKVLGNEHPDTLRSFYDLGWAQRRRASARENKR